MDFNLRNSSNAVQVCMSALLDCPVPHKQLRAERVRLGGWRDGVCITMAIGVSWK
jgi:hypothetical protein